MSSENPGRPEPARASQATPTSGGVPVSADDSFPDRPSDAGSELSGGRPYVAPGNYYWAPNGLSVPEPEQRGIVPMWNAVLRALVAGIVIAALGTVLHANVYWVNQTTWLPVGIFGSIALTICLCVLVGASSGRPMFALVAGLVAYVGVGLMMFGIPKEGLIATNTQVSLPSTAMGWVWVIGLALAIAVGYGLSARVMRAPRR